jgi:uncharacterized damage-inducible protein DinB
MSHLDRLVEHLGWANRRVEQALREAEPVDAQVLRTYAHILAAEHVWHARLLGVTPAVTVWPVLSLAQCVALAEANLAGLRSYLVPLTPDDYHRPISYTNSAGQPFTTGVEDILLHVCLHGSYHRGQIAASLRSTARTPAATDYIAFIRGSPAATRVDRA